MEVPAEPQPPSEKVRRFDLLICSSFYYHSFLLVLKIFMKMLRGADESLTCTFFPRIWTNTWTLIRKGGNEEVQLSFVAVSECRQNPLLFLCILVLFYLYVK